jgi:putative tricarboxylic transport membrane protein
MQASRSDFRWDVLAGLVIIAMAIGFLVVGMRLEFGTLMEMGPGFLPVCTALILAGLGGVIIFEGLTNAPSIPDLPKLRPFLVIVACPIVFAWMIDWAGMVPTVVVTSLLARAAEPLQWGWDLVLVPLALSLIAVLVFIKLIGVAIPAF